MWSQRDLETSIRSLVDDMSDHIKLVEASSGEPCSELVKLCANYASQITLYKGEQGVDAKSIMGVLMLAATQGTILALHVEGEDASAASEAIIKMFGDYFDEGE